MWRIFLTFVTLSLLCKACFCYNKKDHGLISPFIFRTNNARIDDIHPDVLNVFSDTLKLNPHFVQVYFDDDARSSYIQRFYPQLFPFFEPIVPGAFRADLWRLLILHRYGGYYMDVGMRSVQPFSAIEGVKQQTSFLSAIDLQDNYLTQGFLGSAPKLPLLTFMINWVMDNLYHQRYGCNNLDITGPMALGKALNRFLNRPLLASISPGFHILNSSRCRSDQYISVPNDINNAGSNKQLRYTAPQLLSSHVSKLHTIYFLKFQKDFSFTDCADCNVTSDHQNWQRSQLKILQNKFQNYQKAVYSNATHYGVYYYYRNVFKKSVSDNNNNLNISYIFDGGVVQQGRTMWYVVDNKRVPFPNYDVFLQLHMDQCVSCAVKFDVAYELPIVTAEYLTKMENKKDLLYYFKADDMAHNWKVIEQQHPHISHEDVCKQRYAKVSTKHTRNKPPQLPYHSHQNATYITENTKKLLHLYRGQTISAKQFFSVMEPS